MWRQILIVVAMLGAWIVVNRWVLPSMGVST